MSMNWEERLAIYDRLVKTNTKFVRKGKTVPCTTANGYMFSLLNKDGEIGIRLPKETGKKFMEEYESTEYRSHGAVMRDYVLIPDKMLDNMDILGDYLDQGYEYVMSLKSKLGKK